MKTIFLLLLLTSKVFATAPAAGMFGFDGTHTYPVFQPPSAAQGAPSPTIANVGFTATVATNALTITMTNSAGTSLSASAPATIGFRGTTGGQNSLVTISSGPSVVIPSGTTIGTINGQAEFIYVYALNNAGTVVLAVSLYTFDETLLITTSAISGGSSASTVYSTAAQTTLPFRLIGKINITEATAGTWASAPTNISTMPGFVLLNGPIIFSAMILGHSNQLGVISSTPNTLNICKGASCFPAVVSAIPATNGLMIVRGGGATGSSTVAPNSEGYSYTSNTTGTQTLTFTTPFQDTPICLCTVAATNTLFCGYNILVSSTSVEFVTYNTSGTATNAGYSWICIGQRNTAN